MNTAICAAYIKYIMHTSRTLSSGSMCFSVAPLKATMDCRRPDLPEFAGGRGEPPLILFLIGGRGGAAETDGGAGGGGGGGGA